jgi:hypothetical protein
MATSEPLPNRLTAKEMGELELLAFRNANDLPFGPEDAARYDELRTKERRRGA